MNDTINNSLVPDPNTHYLSPHSPITVVQEAHFLNVDLINKEFRRIKSSNNRFSYQQRLLELDSVKALHWNENSLILQDRLIQISHNPDQYGLNLSSVLVVNVVGVGGLICSYQIIDSPITLKLFLVLERKICQILHMKDDLAYRLSLTFRQEHKKLLFPSPAECPLCRHKFSHTETGTIECPACKSHFV